MPMTRSAIIKVENSYSWLYTDDKEIRTLLWRSLRFQAKGYFHSRLYKQKRWDGYVEFFKLESGRFLTGLLPEIEAALDHLGVEYTYQDKRDQVPFRFDSVDEYFLDQWRPKDDPPFIMHDYQVKFVNRAIKYRRGIIKAPTSAGKSACICGILKALPEDCPTLVLTKNVTLVRQIYEDMVKWGLPNAGKVFGSKKKDNIPNIMTAVNIGSIHKLEKILPKIRALIVDEVHLMMSKQPKKVYAKLKACDIRLGVSATPFKFDGKDSEQKYLVKGWFGAPLLSKKEELTTEKLQERNILAKSDCTFFPIDKPHLPYEIYQDAVTYGIAENFHFHEIVTRLVKKLKGRTLILVDRLAHGDMLSDMIPGSLWVRGEDNEDTRKEVIEKLKHAKKDTVAIATQQIFNAGVNVFVHNLLNAAGGQAEHQIIQRMGRGLRVADDKEGLKYYDFIFNNNDYLRKHSMNRIDILKKEGHNITLKDEIDF